jgi:hypothetical protein
MNLDGDVITLREIMSKETVHAGENTGEQLESRNQIQMMDPEEFGFYMHIAQLGLNFPVVDYLLMQGQEKIMMRNMFVKVLAATQGLTRLGAPNEGTTIYISYISNECWSPYILIIPHLNNVSYFRLSHKRRLSAKRVEYEWWEGARFYKRTTTIESIIRAPITYESFCKKVEKHIKKMRESATNTQ